MDSRQNRFPKACCPLCKTNANVTLYDIGFKRVIRFLAGNNRYMCHTCDVTWRRKMPDRYLDIVRKAKA